MPRGMWVGRGHGHRVHGTGVAAVAAVLSLALLAGCGSGKPAGHGKGTGGDGGGHAKAAPPATVTITPATGTANVAPNLPVTVKAAQGTLTAVTVTNPDGKAVNGALSADKTTWTSSEALGYGKAYSVAATAANTDGKAVQAASKFTTVTPANQTMPYIQQQNGATYGVGEPIDVKFDENITDKAAAEKALTVTTTPAIQGRWHWIDDQTVHWRPQTAPGQYWPAGTKVTVTAKVYGVQVGNGLYGQADQTASFTIGPPKIAVADDKTLHMKVYVNGQVVKDMPFSGGKGGYVQAQGGGGIPLWTPSGTMVVLEKNNPVRMTSASWGVDKNSPEAYNLVVNWATRITNDGVFLHAAPWNVDLHGVQNDSHGCINLSDADAQWIYNNFNPGDIVQVTNTPQQFPPTGDGYGDWEYTWAQWVAGSAIK